jgi:hypothetical protein
MLSSLIELAIFIQSSMVQMHIESRVEAGSNNSTVTLRVVRGDEKGTQCLGV